MHDLRMGKVTQKGRRWPRDVSLRSDLDNEGGER
jgi:hypothetical protein